MPNQTQIIWLGYFYKLKLDLFNLIFIGAFNLVNNINTRDWTFTSKINAMPGTQ